MIKTIHITDSGEEYDIDIDEEELKENSNQENNTTDDASDVERLKTLLNEFATEDEKLKSLIAEMIESLNDLSEEGVNDDDDLDEDDDTDDEEDLDEEEKIIDTKKMKSKDAKSSFGKLDNHSVNSLNDSIDAQDSICEAWSNRMGGNK